MEQPDTMATGVPQLDHMLGGGIVRGSLLLIAGPPGCGKTVLCAQLAWASAARDERVLFATAYAEPHNKLISHLSNFQFFDQNQIGGAIKLLNLQHQLALSIAETADTLVREAREHHAQLVILDGFQGVLAGRDNAGAAHQFLFDLSAKLSLLNVTVLIVYDLPPNELDRPELTAIDGILLLTQELYGDQVLRMLQVVKYRGTAHLLGRHSFTITNDGITCYPRQESIVEALNVVPGTTRISFGVPALDALTSGGLNQGTSTIIAGGEGVGKTLLCLHFIMHAVAQGQRAVFLTFHETPQQIVFRGQQLGVDVQAAVDNGALQILHYAPIQLNADIVAHDLRRLIESHPIACLAIDGINELERSLIERGRTVGFFASLITYLRNQRITTGITLEVDPVIDRGLSLADKNISALADNALLLRHVEINEQQVYKLLILKMRFSNYHRGTHTYMITDRGIELETS